MAELGRHRLLDGEEMEVSVQPDGSGFYDCPEERDLEFWVRHHTQRRIRSGDTQLLLGSYDEIENKKIARTE